MKAMHALLAVGLIAATACGDDNDPAGPAGGNTITMTATTFSPATLTIDRNEVVTFSNSSGVSHNVTFTTSGSPADIANHTSGSTTRTFSNEGTYAFTCTNHQGMNGSVVVN